MVRVGIGLIGRAGHYLIRRRPPLPGSPMPGFWEFPGGKCDPGESPEQAAVRECREESGLIVRVLGRRAIITYTYPHGPVELHYFDCATADLASEPDPGSGFRWVPAWELASYRFPEANEAIVAALVGEVGGLSAG